MNRFTRTTLGEISPLRRAAACAVAMMAGAGLTSSPAHAASAPVLIDFGNNQSFRGATTPSPDQNGNHWNSMRTGVFYQNLVDSTGTATTLDFGFSTPVGTDSYNGPAGPTANQPLTQPEIDAADVDQAALGVLGVKAAVVDYVAEFDCRFEIQQLDPTKTYDLTFFGSHKFSNNDATVYSVFSDNTYTTEVASGSLLVQTPGSPWLHNRDTTLTLSNVAPQASNILYVQFTGSEGSFGYLNDMLIREHVAAASAWKVDAGGSWFDATNWTGAVPNGVGAEANFLGAITANRSVNADSPVVAGTLRFNNTHSYVIGGASTMTLQVASGNALVDVQAGTHQINLPLTIASNANLQVAGGATLKISDPMTVNAGISVTQSGGGQVLYESTVTLGASSSIQFGNTSHMAGLTLGAGASAVVTPGANKVLRADNVDVGTGRLDLKDNKLITNKSAGTASGGVYSGLQGDVQRAYNFNAWDQPGLTTSMPDAIAGLTTIGIATGEQMRGLGPTDTDTFAGQTITGASTIAMYTYAGDGNLDGVIDGGDYGIIDNFVQVPGASGYANGDFNYDGVIDGGDYGVIDNNIQAQGAAFPTSGSTDGLAGATAVPEPAACGLAILSAGLLLGRRARRVPGRKYNTSVPNSF